MLAAANGFMIWVDALEIAAIAQRALAEKMASVDNGVWQTLFHRIEAEIESARKKPKRRARAA